MSIVEKLLNELEREALKKSETMTIAEKTGFLKAQDNVKELANCSDAARIRLATAQDLVGSALEDVCKTYSKIIQLCSLLPQSEFLAMMEMVYAHSKGNTVILEQQIQDITEFQAEQSKEQKASS